MAKFTPGPWKIEIYRGRIFIVAENTDEIICTISPWSWDQDNEDARLIAAAPKIYNSHQQLLARMQGVIDMLGFAVEPYARKSDQEVISDLLGYTDNADIVEDLRIARALLARIDGEDDGFTNR